MRGDRAWVARLAAPAAFLLAATVGVLVVRASFDEDDAPAPTARTAVETRPRATTGETVTTRRRQTPAGRFYAIRSGDTLASIAAREGTTVERLLELNPEIDPVALTVGQRIRVE